MKRRRLLSLLLCAAMLCSLMGAPAYADEETPEQATVTEEKTPVGNDAEHSDGADAEGEPAVTEDAKDPAGDPVDDGGEQGSESENEIKDPANPGTDPGLEDGNSNGNEDGGDGDFTGGSDDVDDNSNGDAGEGSGDGAEENGGNASETNPDGNENDDGTEPGAPEQNPDDEQTEVGNDGEQTVVGDELEDVATVLSLEDEPLPLTEAVESGFSLRVSGYSSSSAYCPGATATVTSKAPLTGATVNDAGREASGNSFTLSSLQTTTKITVTDVNGKSATYTVNIGHPSYNYTRIEVKPTCTKKGYTKSYFSCRLCGAILDPWKDSVEKDEVEPLGHDFTESTVDASACGGDPSVTIRTCKRCGFVETTNSGNLGTDHEYEHFERAANCTDEGYSYDKCKNCGAIRDGSYETSPAGPYAHVWSGWETVTEQSCTDPLVIRRHCEVCETEQTMTRAALGHSFTDSSWEITKEPSCTAAGEKRQKCVRCGAVREDGDATSVPATGHNWVEDTDKREDATCTQAGTAHFHCTACNETKTEELAMTGHRQSATAYATDEQGHCHTCEICGEPMGEPEEHAFVNNDCTQPRRCAVCGYEQPGSATPHKFSHQNTSGHSGRCSACGKLLGYEAHKYAETQFCTDERYCTVCGYRPAQFTSHTPKAVKWADSGDGETHYRECSNTPSCTYRFTQPHVLPANRDCTKGIYCTVCGALVVAPTSGHVWSKSEHQDDSIGIVHCTNPHCTQTEERKHSIQVEEEVEQEATCTTDGVKIVHKWCEGCSFTFEDERVTVPASGHSFNAWHHVDTPTCNDAGLEQHECQNCSFVETKELDATGHVLGDWEELTPATCTTDGTAVRKCTKCGQVQESKEIPELGHSYKDVGEVPATCESDAYKIQECARCGESTIHVEMPNTRLGHKFVDYTYQNDATCTEDGTEIGTCERCGVLGGVRTAPGTATGHVYQMDNDCTTAEECTLCGKLSETFPSHSAPKDAPWQIDPVKGTHYKLCANPHCEQIAVEEPHVPAEDDGDCTTSIYCTVCGAEVEPGNAAHDFSTWTEDGDVHVSDCAEDDCTQTAREPHEFLNYVYQGDAKCGVDGTEVATCAKCGAKDVRTAAGTAIAHEPDGTPGVVVDPTCTEQGYTIYHCRNCGEPFDTVFVDPLGHEPDPAYDPIVTEPTCTEQGFTTYACARCGEVYRADFVPKSGHKAVSEGDKAATCTEPGYRGGTHCSVCGETLSARTAIPALGHSFGAWNASGAGSHTAACTRCGATKSESCGYSEIKIGATTVNVCKVCGDVIDPSGGETVTASRFEVVADAASEEIDPGAIPSGCELIVRKLDVPFQETDEVLEAFTVGCEQNGVALPLQGKIRVTMPVSCPMPFRLIRVDVIEDAQTGETAEQMVEIEFTYESGRITFETDRDGMFLLTQLDEAA